MKKILKGVSLVTALLILISVLSACGGRKDEKDGTTPEKTTTQAEGNKQKPAEETEKMKIDKVSYVMRSWNQVQWEDSNFDKMVKERFGLELDLQVIDLSSYREKFRVMFNTNNLPDVSTVFGIDISSLNQAGDRGLFLDYYDYMDEMPVLRKIITDNKPIIPYITAASGSLYYSPIYYGVGYKLENYGFGVRKDLLDKARFDYSNLESMDDLYAMYKALKEQAPEKYVLGANHELVNIFRVGELMGISDEPATWDPKKEEWIRTYDQPAMKDFLTFWANAYEEGILHPDFLTMQSNDMWQKCYNGELTAYIEYLRHIDICNDNASSDEMEWTYVMPPLYKGEKHGIVAMPGFGWVNAKIVNSSTKVPEKVMKFIDWTYTDEGYLRSMFGEEGVDYALLESDPVKWIALDESNKDTLPEEYHDKLLSVEEIAKRKVEAPYFLYGFYSKSNTWNRYQKWKRPYVDTVFEEAHQRYIQDGWYSDPSPNVALLDDELEEFNDLSTAINDYAIEMISRIITGQVDIGKWSEVVDEIYQMDYDRLMELYEISYENFTKVEPKFNP